ncbi:BZ3500_MvSof-1268-A1-R1_Chr9g10322 [Microbotryum saponariae]|uniref:BZ3500_MvSof-1268-A1-R1_Chr9g10322 protein n=1 Tax=Microbotryum saponariae TaxID=289078 RepID=A0A2X0MBK7_9BASI|nr:BZ3501_MvSof-1269-A2-R1_Chr9g10072 [Microbotryum saponariae]SCZ99902.1 BZ3500_MvSof-1268-A1-R1_Chr9g10322 [Microbotryum saponariae]
MPTTYVVTGASRGLGLELVRQLLSTRPENRVIALARNPSMAKDLNELVKTQENEGRGLVFKADVTDEPSLQAAAKEIEASSFGKNGIDVLINNAGIAQGAGTVTNSSVEEFRANFETNVIGVVQSTLALLPLLRKGSKKQIFVISSGLGPIGGGYQVSWAATYSASKTAVNMWTVKLARELEPEGFTVVLQCPGHVQTDMGGKDASLTPYESINGVLNNTIYKVGPSDTGKFFNQSGGQNPW